MKRILLPVYYERDFFAKVAQGCEVCIECIIPPGKGGKGQGAWRYLLREKVDGEISLRVLITHTDAQERIFKTASGVVTFGKYNLELTDVRVPIWEGQFMDGMFHHTKFPFKTLNS